MTTEQEAQSESETVVDAGAVEAADEAVEAVEAVEQDHPEEPELEATEADEDAIEAVADEELVDEELETETLADATFDKIGYPNSGGTYDNVNGDFTLDASSNCTGTMTVRSGGTPAIYVNTTNTDTGNDVCIGIARTSADDIGTLVNYGDGT